MAADNLALKQEEVSQYEGLAKGAESPLKAVERGLDQQGIEGIKTLEETAEKQKEATITDLNEYRVRVTAGEALPAEAQQQLASADEHVRVAADTAVEALKKDVQKVEASLQPVTEPEAAPLHLTPGEKLKQLQAMEASPEPVAQTEAAAALAAHQQVLRERQAAKSPGVELGEEKPVPAVSPEQQAKIEKARQAMVRVVENIEPEELEEELEAKEAQKTEAQALANKQAEAALDTAEQELEAEELQKELQANEAEKAAALSKANQAAEEALKQHEKEEAAVEELDTIAKQLPKSETGAEAEIPVEVDWKSLEEAWDKDAKQSEEYLTAYKKNPETMGDIHRAHGAYLNLYLERANRERGMARLEGDLQELIQKKQAAEKLGQTEQAAQLNKQIEDARKEIQALEPLLAKARDEEAKGLVEYNKKLEGSQKSVGIEAAAAVLAAAGAAHEQEEGPDHATDVSSIEVPEAPTDSSLPSPPDSKLARVVGGGAAIGAVAGAKATKGILNVTQGLLEGMANVVKHGPEQVLEDMVKGATSARKEKPPKDTHE